jgi:hypothetical protein
MAAASFQRDLTNLSLRPFGLQLEPAFGAEQLLDDVARGLAGCGCYKQANPTGFRCMSWFDLRRSLRLQDAPNN